MMSQYISPLGQAVPCPLPPKNVCRCVVLPVCICLQPELLPEVVELLQGSAASQAGGRQSSNALQVEQIVRVMRKWGQMNGVMV